jgi:gamma-glutamyl-gamma-aminobutyrate hydrolase PuuD
MTRRPLVGVTCNVELSSWGDWRLEACVLNARYPEAVLEAGGEPVLLVSALSDCVDAVKRIDALVLAGGPDVDPTLYGEAPAPSTSSRPARDRHEIELFRAADDRGLPTLAICRGMQLANVARGGTLVQHLPDVLGHDDHLRTRGRFDRHPVRVAPDSALGATVGDAVHVHSYHHQGIGRVGRGLRPVAWACDGSIEALEDPDRPGLSAVLWHPELDDDCDLFTSLITR